jgi:hypothetical protein
VRFRCVIAVPQVGCDALLPVPSRVRYSAAEAASGERRNERVARAKKRRMVGEKKGADATTTFFTCARMKLKVVVFVVE